VEFFDALPLVLGSYLTFGAVSRRVRLFLGKVRGAQAPAFRVFHHRALAEELGRAASAETGPLVIRPPHSKRLGPFPPAWARSGWFLESPPSLREARDLLLAGAAEQAALLARSEDPERMEELFTWAVLVRIWADQLEAGEEVARALGEVAEDPALARRLLAWIEARRAEEDRGPGGDEAAARALMHLDLVGDALFETPAWAAFPVHLALLRRSWLRLEWDLFDAGRRLKAAAAKHRESAIVHLLRAHRAAALGDVNQAADHLARALYHGRHDPYFAAPVLCLDGLEALRPALFAEARALLDEAPKIDTREAGVLESGPSHRGPIP
jgi:hypothetical protein